MYVVVCMCVCVVWSGLGLVWPLTMASASLVSAAAARKVEGSGLR